MARGLEGKVSIVENLCRRGILLDGSSDICVLCGREREVIDCLFVHYEFARFIWCLVLDKSGVSWCMPSSVATVFEAWGLIPFFGNGKVLWRMIPFEIVWSMWPKMNARIFRRSSMPKEDVSHLALWCIAIWAYSRDEFNSVLVGGILQLGNFSSWRSFEGSWAWCLGASYGG